MAVLIDQATRQYFMHRGVDRVWTYSGGMMTTWNAPAAESSTVKDVWDPDHLN